MRELFFSVGITLLTSTLLFVYFRNKHNNLDEKVNLVFTTIQEHNEKMQLAADEEMQRMANFQRQQREMHMRQQYNSEESNKHEEVQEQQNQNNLIDVSDGEDNNENFDSDDSDESDDSDDSEDDTENKDEDNNLEELKLENLEEKEEKEEKEVLLISDTDYTALTKTKLKDLCEKRDISGYKSCNKGKLIQLLLESDNDNKLGLE